VPAGHATIADAHDRAAPGSGNDAPAAEIVVEVTAFRPSGISAIAISGMSITDAAKILDVPAGLITPCLDELAAAEGVVREQVPAAARPAPAQAAPQVPAAYLPPFYHAERSLARALLRLHASRTDRLSAFAAVDWDKALGWLRSRTGSELAPEQADAVRLALTAKVAVLTGGPGCGKSFTVRSVVELARAKNAKIVLAAPTGRAAKRLAELVGHEAAPSTASCNSAPAATPPSTPTSHSTRTW
jgi:exodeoxyribonuclease V alpha subunit